MELLLVRHALPSRTVKGEGRPDPELSAEGRSQADALAQWLAPVRVDAVWSSPLLRAHQTAQPLATARGLEIRTDPDLTEMDFGLTRYVPYEEATRERLGDYERFRDMLRNQRALGEFTVFRDRVSAALRRIVDAGPDRGGLQVVVCHGGVVNAALAAALETPDTFNFPFGYTSVTHLRVARSGRLRAVSVNDSAHLGVRSYSGRTRGPTVA